MNKPDPKPSQSPTLRHLRIAIVGAGISGLSTALALSQKGFTNIELFERAEKLEEVGAGIQLGPNAVRLLRSMELGEPLDGCADSSAWGYMRDGESNHLLTRLPLSEYSQEKYGVPSYQVLRSDLHGLISEQVKADGIVLHTGKQVSRVEGKSNTNKVAELHFNDGHKQIADLVIGADGLNSVLANQLYPNYPCSFSGLVCWRAMIDNSVSNNAANKINSMSVWVGTGKHLIVYPVANSTRLNLVGVMARENWDFLSHVQDSTTEDWLSAYEGWAPEAIQLIARAESPQLWGLFERAALPGWSKDGCVLVGDAAHPMLPSLAQGAAQGIEDAVILAELLSTASDVSELDAICEQFYQRRHERVERVQKSARWNVNYFHQPKGFLRSCRNLSMQLAGPMATALIARRYHWLYRQ